jgi:hypothetical protein
VVVGGTIAGRHGNQAPLSSGANRRVIIVLYRLAILPAILAEQSCGEP